MCGCIQIRYSFSQPQLHYGPTTTNIVLSPSVESFTVQVVAIQLATRPTELQLHVSKVRHCLYLTSCFYPQLYARLLHSSTKVHQFRFHAVCSISGYACAIDPGHPLTGVLYARKCGQNAQN